MNLAVPLVAIKSKPISVSSFAVSNSSGVLSLSFIEKKTFPDVGSVIPAPS